MLMQFIFSFKYFFNGFFSVFQIINYCCELFYLKIFWKNFLLIFLCWNKIEKRNGFKMLVNLFWRMWVLSICLIWWCSCASLFGVTHWHCMNQWWIVWIGWANVLYKLEEKRFVSILRLLGRFERWILTEDPICNVANCGTIPYCTPEESLLMIIETPRGWTWLTASGL